MKQGSAPESFFTELPGVRLTSHDADFRNDPHRVYDALRSAAVPVRNEDYGCRVVTDYRQVHAALKHKSLSVDATRAGPESYMRRVAGTGVREGVGETAYEPPLVLLDDPAHRRIRQLVSRAFNPGVIDAMRPRIDVICRDLLARLGDRRDLDFIRDFAGPLPTMVILDMLGMPLNQAGTFKRWSEDVLWGYDPEHDSERQGRLRSAFLNMSTAFREAIEARRQTPGDDLLSGMLTVESETDPEERLSELQIISLCTQLMVAGNVTTTDLIGNGMHALLTHPDQLAWLRAHPDRLVQAVEEMLRYDCPITETARIPLEDATVAGCPVSERETLMLSLSAANHDPTRFEEPHRLNLERKIDQHLAFGSGIHVCLGAPLARLEAEIAYASFLDRYEQIERHPEQKAERRHLPFFRGFETLPLRVQ